MVSGGVDDGDPFLLQAPKLLDQHTLGPEREALSVEEVPGEHHGVHTLCKSEIYHPRERVPRRLSEPSAHVFRAGDERRIEMKVCRVKEAHSTRTGRSWRAVARPIP